ncbi:MAG: ATP-binding protein, partial [Cyclobacteriaceae bacterium]
FRSLGRKTLSYSKIDTQEMVAEVIQESMVLEKREVDWDVKHLDEIRGDVSMMRLVWNNLLSNALKYSRNTTKTKIEIGSYAEKGNTVFYVKDNGVGFDMAYSDKLFKVFSRLHKETEFEGTGVGLALVHRIISKHDGKIWVESQVNKGATFMFYLNNPTL